MGQNKYPLPPSMISIPQAKPMIRMINSMLGKHMKSALARSMKRGKITTGDIKIKEKKIKFY